MYQSQFIEQFSKYGQSRKLGDVVKLMDDRRKPINDAERQAMKTGELYPYYGATGQVDSINSYLTDDTLLCIAEDCGNYKGGEESSYIITGKAWVNNHAHLVKPNEDCDITFLHYYLTISDLSPYVTGTTRQKLTQKSLVSIPVVTPPVEEQKAFVSIVLQADKSKFDGFKSQFVSQFGFPQDGADRYPSATIGSLLHETISGEWGTDCTDEAGTKVIRTTNFTNNGVLDLTDIVVRTIDPNKVEKKHLKKGDIILEKSGGTKDNPVGRLVYFEEDGIYLTNNFTQVLRPADGINSKYLFSTLFYLYQTHKSLIKGLGNQTNGIQNLKVPQYLQLQIYVPNRDKQDEFELISRQADKSKYMNSNTTRYVYRRYS